MFSGFSSLADHFLPAVKLQELATLGRLERMVVVLLARCINKKITVHSGAWSSQHFVNQMIEYSSSEAVEIENAATDISKAEEVDVAERGRGLAKAEFAEFALMRTHALWKHFVQDISALQSDNTQTVLDYTELQLQSGLPTVCCCFLCLVDIKADFPWDFLANYRLAKRPEFGMLQLFLGREMLRDATGTVPEMHSGWKAPSFLIKCLVDNKASSINWE